MATATVGYIRPETGHWLDLLSGLDVGDWSPAELRALEQVLNNLGIDIESRWIDLDEDQD